MLSGLLVSLTIRHCRARRATRRLGFKAARGPAASRDLPGIVLAALATLSLGAVLGPEAPLIAIGGGLGGRRGAASQKGRPPHGRHITASAGTSPP